MKDPPKTSLTTLWGKKRKKKKSNTCGPVWAKAPKHSKAKAGNFLQELKGRLCRSHIF